MKKHAPRSLLPLTILSSVLHSTPLTDNGRPTGDPAGLAGRSDLDRDSAALLPGGGAQPGAGLGGTHEDDGEGTHEDDGEGTGYGSVCFKIWIGGLFMANCCEFFFLMIIWIFSLAPSGILSLSSPFLIHTDPFSLCSSGAAAPQQAG